MIKDNVKMVVFDMAGTTIDEQKMVYKCVRAALSDYGFEFSLEEVLSRIGGMNKREGIGLLMRAEDANITDEAVQVVFDLFKQNVEEAYRNDVEIKEMDGASELFQFLKSNDIKVVLDTGYFRSTADLLISKMGWLEKGLIDYSVTSDEVLIGRPEPYMIDKAREYFSLTQADQIAKVGDTRSDIEEGKNAGCKYIVGVSSSQYSKEDLIKMGATHAIDQLSELKDILMEA